MKVLVTDGDARAALALARGLGEAGHTVFVTTPASGSIAGMSRFCAAEFLLRPPEDTPAEHARTLRNLLVGLDIDLVLGVTDRSLTLLHGLGDPLISSRMPPPDASLYFMASDKVRLFQLCRDIGVATPRGIVVSGGTVPAATDLAPLGRRVVVRPALSWRIANNQWVRGAVGYEEDPGGLVRRVDSDPALRHDYLVQERIDGDGCGLFLLAEGGRVLVTFSHRRLREKPPEGGVSTLCESVAVPDDLAEPARRIVEAFEWSGLAMLEFKRARSTGQPLLLEVNARPWGSMALAAAAGLDFANNLLRLARGAHPASGSFREGVRLRWWWGDVDHFYILEKERGCSGAKALFHALLNAVTASPASHASDTFRVDDPLPFVGETANWMFR